jgi:hypothetical protein
MLPRVLADFDEHVQKSRYATRDLIATGARQVKLTPVSATLKTIASPSPA